MSKNSKKQKSNESLTFFSGAWKAEEQIGAGSYGKVYKAKKTGYGIDTYCAIKRIEIPSSQSEIQTLRTEGMTQKDVEIYLEEALEKWVDEIKFMSIFKDSLNIVNIEDYEITKKQKEIGWYIDIRMELLTNLDNYVFENNVTDKDIIKMAMDISNALIDCEENSVIHRDIKPENIFVSRKKVYKLGDFGIAKKINGTVSNLSKKGTENYMAPELYKTEKGDKTVDIYSLGIMLYRFFNYNRLPFLPDYPNQVSYKDRIESLEKRISGEKMKAPKNANREIANIILKACSYYPKDRYQSAEELNKELKNIYDSIEKPTILFDYNDKNMSRIFKENSKRENSDNQTKSVFNTKKGATIKNKENDERKVNNYSAEKVEDVPEDAKEVENIKIDNKNNKPQSINDEVAFEVTDKSVFSNTMNQIDKNASVSKKDKKRKIPIIILIILILIVLAVFLIFIVGNKRTNEKSIIMPNVVGMDLEQATTKLEDLGIKIEYEYDENDTEAGKVLEQSINENSKIDSDTVVKLKVAVPSEKVKVINVVGKTEDEAIEMLKQIGLSAHVEKQYSDVVEKGVVISQMINEGEEVNKNMVIDLLVSNGKKPEETTTTTKNQEQPIVTTKVVPKTTTKKASYWSEWVEKLPAGVTNSKYAIETKKQYRSSKKETKAQNSPNLNGWIKYDQKNEYSEWSSNKTSTSAVTPSDTLEIVKKDTKTSIVYYHYDNYYNGGWNVDSIPWGTGNYYHEIIVDSDAGFGIYYDNDHGGNQMYSNGAYFCSSGFQVWFRGRENSTTTYTYRTRTKTTKYYFYRWGSWSGWSDTKVNANDNLKVETRTLYRYKEL